MTKVQDDSQTDGEEVFDGGKFYSEHLSWLWSLAERYCGKNDDADEAAHETLLVAIANPNLIPITPRETRNWLVAILRKRVLQVKSHHHKHVFVDRPQNQRSRSARKDELLGSNQNAIVELARDRFTEPVIGDTLSVLSLDEREALFEGDWQKRVAACDRLRRENELAPGLSPQMHLLDFARYYVTLRGIKRPDDYVSQCRTLNRTAGKLLRLQDLTPDIYARCVRTLSKSSRKRMDALWHAAATMGLTKRVEDKRTFALDHPMYWSRTKLERFVAMASRLSGTIAGTAIPRAFFWQGIVPFVAETGRTFSRTLQLDWATFRNDMLVHCRISPSTAKALEKLEASGEGRLFPWKVGSFHRHYGRLLRLCNAFEGTLTRREQDVLVRTAEGNTDRQISTALRCRLEMISLYRRRLREKLNVAGTKSLYDLVLVAKERQLLPESFTLQNANRVVYKKSVHRTLEGLT